MIQRKLGLVVFVLGICLVGSKAVATECVSEYTWKCDDKQPNACKGFFFGVLGAGDIEAYQESNPDVPQCPSAFPPAHELRQVLRFSDLPKGGHKVRLSYDPHDVCGDESGPQEVVTLSKRVANGCEETGIFQVIQSLDEDCCSEMTDYDLSNSGMTDICISFASTNSRGYRDEFYVSHQAGHSHPAIVTTLDTVYTGDGEVTNPGIIYSGNYTNTRTSDNVREVLKEAGAQHRLLHVYEIKKIPDASSYKLKVEGYRPNNSDGDNFQIIYRWSSTGCTTTGIFQNSGITINSEAESTYEATIGRSPGSLCVAVDDTTGGSTDDSVFIDRVFLEITDPVCP
jgi:hypothetical protein